jgi:2-polyprenyl-3-methyl-5-hydroxy-6-metoxy-1,4-benzoquinol methylase
MVNSSLVQLKPSITRAKDPFAIIDNYARGKKVLNVGSAGGVEGYLPGNTEHWLHERLIQVAESVVGIDIDTQNLAHAKKHGYPMMNENCETMNLGQKFDLIVMSDVIEHVNAPVTAVSNLIQHLGEGGKLLITTPNATAGATCIRSMTRRRINVLNDHVAVYYPEHFQVICDRIGVKLTEMHLFDHMDKRTVGNRFKSILFRTLTLISTRMASSLMAVIEK